MLRRLIAGAAVFATSFLSACEDAPVSTVVYSSGRETAYLDYVGARGSLLVEPLNNPFSVGETWFGETLAGIVRSSVTYRKLQTTSDPLKAAEAQFRVRFVFDAPESFNPRLLCKGQVPDDLEKGDRMRVLATFCNGEDMEAAVRGSVRYPTEPVDDLFQKLIAQMARQMFTPPGPGSR